MNENNLGGRIADLLKQSGLLTELVLQKYPCHDISVETEPLRDRLSPISQMRCTLLLITY